MEVILLIQSNTLLQVVTMRFCCQRFLCDSRATFALVSQNITTTLRCVFNQNLCVFVARNCTEHSDRNSKKRNALKYFSTHLNISKNTTTWLSGQDVLSTYVMRTSIPRHIVEDFRESTKSLEIKLGEAENGLAASFFFRPNPSHSPLH